MAEKVRANVALDLAAGRGGLKCPKEKKLAEGLSPATCLLLVRLLSTLYTDLIESHRDLNGDGRPDLDWQGTDGVRRPLRPGRCPQAGRAAVITA